MRRFNSHLKTRVGKADFIHGLVDVLQHAYTRLRDAFVEGVEEDLVFADARVVELTRTCNTHIDVVETIPWHKLYVVNSYY